MTVLLYTDEDDSLIYYTLDGAVPDTSSARYLNPVHITRTSVLQARVIKQGALPGKMLTRTYFINEEVQLPVIS